MSEAETNDRSIYQLVSAVQSALAKKGIGKAHTNTFDNYKFRGIDDVYNALGPILSEHKLVIYPEVTERDVVERQSKKGDPLFHVTLNIIYHFVSAHDGSEMVVPVVGEAMDRGDKAINKAMSAGYKLACFQTFCIPIEGQDSEAETHEVKKSNRVIDAALEGVEFTAEQQKMIQDYRASLIAAVNNEDDPGVLELVDELRDDQELKMGVWAALSEFSKVRRHIQKLERERG